MTDFVLRWVRSPAAASAISSALADVLECSICNELMRNPYVTSCGHSFCGPCLANWFRTNPHRPTCPACRSSVTHEPVPSHGLRHIIDALVTAYNSAHPGKTVDWSDGENHTGPQTLFGSMDWEHPYYDAEDSVMRCPNCSFELWGGHCERCGRDYDVSSDDNYSDQAMFSDGGNEGIDEEAMNTSDREFIAADEEVEAQESTYSTSDSDGLELDYVERRRVRPIDDDEDDNEDEEVEDTSGYPHLDEAEAEDEGSSDAPIYVGSRTVAEDSEPRSRRIITIDDSDSD